jgi:hypothetical protein
VIFDFFHRNREFRMNGRAASSDVTYIGAFYFRNANNARQDVMVGHVATPLLKTQSKNFAIPEHFKSEEFLLTELENTSMTKIKKDYFKCLNTTETNALGLIMATAKEFRRLIQTFPNSTTENKEHTLFISKIKELIEKSDRESREFTMKRNAEMNQQMHTLLKMSEETLKSGPNWDKMFTESLARCKIDPAVVHADILTELSHAGDPPNAAAVTAPSSYPAPSIAPSIAPISCPMPEAVLPQMTAPAAAAEETPSDSLVLNHARGGTPLNGRASALPWLLGGAHHADTESGRVSVSRLTDSRGWPETPDGRPRTTPDLLRAGFYGTSPFGTIGWHEGTTDAALLLLFHQQSPGTQDHVRILQMGPILCGVILPRLQDPGLASHVITHSEVRPVPLAHMIMGQEADVRVGRRGGISGDVLQGVAAIGLIQFRVGLQPIADQIPEEVLEHGLLLFLPLHVLTDGMFHTGVGEENREQVVSCLHNLTTQPVGPFLNSGQGHRDWRIGQGP